MQTYRLVVILILFLSLLLQILNFVIVGYGNSVYTSLDTINPPKSGYPSFKQQNNGNNGYIAVSAAISSIIYLYLFIVKRIKKNCSDRLDQILLLLAVCFQFGIIVTYFIFLRNNQVRFQYALKTIDNLEAIQQGLPAGSSIPDLISYRKLFVLRSLNIAASILTLLICVGGGFFLVLKQNFFKMQSHRDIKSNDSISYVIQTTQNQKIDK